MSVPAPLWAEPTTARKSKEKARVALYIMVVVTRKSGIQ